MTTTLWAGLAFAGWQHSADQFGGHLNPMVFHLAGSFSQSVTTAAVFILLRRLFQSPSAALVGALLFGIHPIQTEAVVFSAR